jgi:hypothetical protein
MCIDSEQLAVSSEREGRRRKLKVQNPKFKQSPKPKQINNAGTEVTQVCH